jgi:hypothetical protein
MWKEWIGNDGWIDAVACGRTAGIYFHPLHSARYCYQNSCTLILRESKSPVQMQTNQNGCVLLDPASDIFTGAKQYWLEEWSLLRLVVNSVPHSRNRGPRFLDLIVMPMV